MKSALVFALSFTLLATTACGTTGVPVESQDTESTAIRRRTNQISAEELADYRHLNARDAIQQLRPRWFRTRSREDSFGTPEDAISVYVSNFFRGGPDELRRLNVSDIERIDFLTEQQAFQRFGSQHRNNAILITLKGR